MKRKPLIIAAVVIAVILVVLLLLPSLIDVNRYKPELQSTLGTALGRQVDVGNIKLAIFSGGVELEDLSISDDPAFSRQLFLKAKQLTVGVNLIPLVFSKRLEVRSFGVVDPEVSLWRNAAGIWNYSSLGGSAAKAKSKGGDTSTGNLTVEKLTISNGKITVGTVGSHAKPIVYQDVNLEASDFSATSPFPFKFSAKDPANGAVKVEGKAGPIDQADTSLTPLNAKITVEHLDLGASGGLLGAASGLGGLLDFDGTLISDGHQFSSKGTVKTNKLKLAANGGPSSVPVNVDYDTSYDLKKQSGTLSQGDIHIGKALARLTGTYNVAGEEATLQLKMKGQAMPASDLEGVLPAVGVTLPSGAKLQGGTLEADLSITGPANRLVILGPINLSNSKLAGYNMKSKLGALGSFAGLGGGGGGSDTEIQTLSTNLRQGPEGTHAQNLNIVIPSIGTITGDGNVSASGQLDCKMVAKLSGGAMGAVSQVSKLSPLGGGSQGGGIPFKITGTTSNPIFLPDVAGMAKSQLGGITSGASGITGKPAGALGGLFGKKKNQ